MSGSFAKQIMIVALGLILCISGIDTWHEETYRSMTLQTAVGVVENVHTVSAGRNETLHFIIIQGSAATRDLYTEEPPMFMKARGGQQVEATFTQETGYVSKLSIVGGPSAGFDYDEPDQRNTFGAIAMLLLGFAMVAFGGFQLFTDRQARLGQVSNEV